MIRAPRWLVVGLVTESVAFGAIGLLLLDMTMHRRVAERDGVNRWGYRGPIAVRRRAPDHRLVVVGGSAAFGYGNPLDETFPAYLERNLQQRWRAGFRARAVKVINLAGVPDDAGSFRQTLGDYEYLDYDFVCFYDGYNSLTGPFDASGWRRRSAVFRRTGYLPILPLLAAGESPVGRPRTPAAEPSVPLAAESREAATASDCGPRWERYCAAMDAAVGFVLESGRTALVVTPPVLSPAHEEQQRALAAVLATRFGRHPRFRYLDFSSLVDLHDRNLSEDGVHLTARGNDVVADALTGPVFQLLR
jgi:hypothetical protein